MIFRIGKSTGCSLPFSAKGMGLGTLGILFIIQLGFNCLKLAILSAESAVKCASTR